MSAKSWAFGALDLLDYPQLSRYQTPHLKDRGVITLSKLFYKLVIVIRGDDLCFFNHFFGYKWGILKGWSAAMG